LLEQTKIVLAKEEHDSADEEGRATGLLRKDCEVLQTN
jgi:hypothetical protein